MVDEVVDDKEEGEVLNKGTKIVDEIFFIYKVTLWSRLAGAQDDERGDKGRQGHRRGVELRVRAGDYAGVGAKRVCLGGDGWLRGGGEHLNSIGLFHFHFSFSKPKGPIKSASV